MKRGGPVAWSINVGLTKHFRYQRDIATDTVTKVEFFTARILHGHASDGTEWKPGPVTTWLDNHHTNFVVRVVDIPEWIEDFGAALKRLETLVDPTNPPLLVEWSELTNGGR